MGITNRQYENIDFYLFVPDYSKSRFPNTYIGVQDAWEFSHALSEMRDGYP